MKIHYFPDEKDVGTTFSFEDEKGNDNVNEMKEFSQWLDSMDLNFTKVKLRQGGGRATSCIVVEGLESDDEEEEEEQDNQDEQFKSGLMEALFHLQNKVTTMENSSPKVEQAVESTQAAQVVEAEADEETEEVEEKPTQQTVKVEEPAKQVVEEKPVEKKESEVVKKKKKKKEKKEVEE